MFLKAKIEGEQFYWDKQIERHHTGKRIRNLVRKINYKPYKQLSEDLNISRKTLWAIANGLATASPKLINKIERLEKFEKI